MDDDDALVNSVHSFLIFDDDSSRSNLASQVHPRLNAYKKSATKSSQEERRRILLAEQKK